MLGVVNFLILQSYVSVTPPLRTKSKSMKQQAIYIFNSNYNITEEQFIRYYFKLLISLWHWSKLLTLFFKYLPMRSFSRRGQIEMNFLVITNHVQYSTKGNIFCLRGAGYLISRVNLPPPLAGGIEMGSRGRYCLVMLMWGCHVLISTYGIRFS